MNTLTRNPMSAAGSIFNFVGNLANAATASLESLNNGITMMNTTVHNASVKHEIKSAAELSNFLEVALQSAQMEAAEQKVELLKQLNGDRNLKEAFDASEERLRKVFKESADKMGVDLHM